MGATFTFVDLSGAHGGQKGAKCVNVNVAPYCALLHPTGTLPLRDTGAYSRGVAVSSPRRLGVVPLKEFVV